MPEYNNKDYQEFSQRFGLHGSYLDVTVEFELDQETRDKYLPYNLTFKTPLIEYTMSDISYDDFLDNFLKSYSDGGNSGSSISRFAGGTYLEFANHVSGGGGDSSFDMKVPMSLAEQIHKMLCECQKTCNLSLKSDQN